MLDEIYNKTQESMSKSLDGLKKDFTTLRSGKVSTSIVENIRVDYYGTPTPLSQVGSVLAPDATTIVINPWEKNILKDIEKAIQEANIGVNPNNDGESIKLFFPAMTVEQRKETAKKTKVMGEKSKVSIRNIRKDANNDVKKLEKDKVITEDESKKAHDEIQKITDEFTKMAEEAVKQKEAEILKV